MQHLQFPLSTGQVCRLLQTPEHRVINPIRQGKLSVLNVGCRRLWAPGDILIVAKLLGKDTPEIRNLCRDGGPRQHNVTDAREPGGKISDE